jgi:lipoate-protein ligase A
VHCTAGDQHSKEFVPTRGVFDVRITSPAVVLGSRQSVDLLNTEQCGFASVEVVRRTSGGGVVFLSPGAHVWLDIVIPRSDVHWIDDVGQSMWWLGDVWVKVLEAIGIDGALVRRGPLNNDAWGELVCFAGVGPGEVTDAVSGAKIVGMSQRRTREYAKFQCTLFLEWSPAQFEPFLATAPGQIAAINDRVKALPMPADIIVDALMTQLRSPLIHE